MNIGNATLLNYSLDEDRSSKGRSATRLEPAEPKVLALHIRKIAVELKISQIKQLQVGDEIEFNIDQNLEFSVPDRRSKDYKDIKEYFEVKGAGEIEELEELPLLESYGEEETEEITITLKNGASLD